MAEPANDILLSLIIAFGFICVMVWLFDLLGW